MRLKNIFNMRKVSFWAWIVAMLIFCESLHITLMERYIVDGTTGQLWQPTYFNVRIFLMCIMVLCLAFLLSVLQGSGKHRERNIYWLTVVLIILAIFIRYPIRSWQAEPYWETSTNILWQTYNRGPLKSLLLDDSGYWTLLPRIMAVAIIFLFKQVRYAALILQLSCTLLFAFTCAKVVKREFAEYLPIENRFILALLLGTTTFFYLPDIIVAHNIAYVGGILFIMCCFMNMDEVPLPILVLDIVIIMLSCCSKMHLLVFAPVIIILLLFVKKMHPYLKTLLICTFISNLLMIFYYISGIAEASSFGISKDIVSVLLTSVFEYLQAWIYLIKPYWQNGYYSGWIYNLIVAIVVISILIISLKYKSKKTIALWSLSAIMFGNIMVNVLVNRVSDSVTDLKGFLLATSYVSNRNSLLTLAAMIFILFFVVLSDNYFFKKTLYKEIIVLGFSAFLTMHFLLIEGTRVNTYFEMNWKEYSDYLVCDSYGIPAGTGSSELFLLKNAKVKYWGSRELWTHNGHFATGVSQVNKLDEKEVNNLILDNESTVIAVYTQKKSLFNEGMPRILLLGRDNNILGMIDGITDKDRYSIGFISDKPIEGVERILFVTTNGNLYPVKSEIYVVVEAPGLGLRGDAGWGQSSLEE